MISVAAGIPGSVSYEELQSVSELISECLYPDDADRGIIWKLARNTILAISTLTGCLVCVIVTLVSLNTVGHGKVPKHVSRAAMEVWWMGGGRFAISVLCFTVVMGTICGAMSLYYLIVVKFYDKRALEDTCNKAGSIQQYGYDCMVFGTYSLFAIAVACASVNSYRMQKFFKSQGGRSELKNDNTPEVAWEEIYGSSSNNNSNNNNNNGEPKEAATRTGDDGANM